jgi:hypothetical protein
MNGMTQCGPLDEERGLAFEWDGVDRRIAFDIAPEHRDLRSWESVSFRACQMTRHALTTAESGDLTFSVTLRDANGVEGTLDIGAYPGGVEEPYQRAGCGAGAGWANEFETIRLRLDDFARSLPPLQMSDVVRVELRFGPSFGSPRGRIGLDDLEITRR